MSIKAQPPREPTLPSRAPTTLPPVGIQADLSCFRPGREMNTAGQANRAYHPDKPGLCLFSPSWHNSVTSAAELVVFGRLALAYVCCLPTGW